MSKMYYYFAASLPSLQFDMDPPCSVEEFLQQCERLLDQGDFTLINDFLTEHEHHIKTKNTFYNKIVKFKQDFRNERAWFRAENAGKDPADYIRGERYADPFFIGIIEEASKAQNPLEAEKVLDKARWSFLDDLETGHYFDFAFILIHGLRLQILQRYERVRSPKGSEIYKELKEVDIPINTQV